MTNYVPVTERIEALRDELRRLDPSAPGLRNRIERIKRQLAMLTEDQRKPMTIPERSERFL